MAEEPKVRASDSDASVKASGGERGGSTIVSRGRSLEEYYRGLFQKYFSSDGSSLFSQTLATLREPLPASLRVSRTGSLWHVVAEQLDTFCKKNGEGAEGGRVPWFPSRLAWQWDTLNRIEIRKVETHARLKAFLIREDTRGTLVRQESASMIPPLFLDLKPTHLILDMCAAPGSKTSQIAEGLAVGSLSLQESVTAMLQSGGCVVANEVDVKRASMLTHQMQRMQTCNIGIMCSDAANFPNFESTSPESRLYFDRILADVPCSGDGTLRKNPDIWTRWTAAGAIGLHQKQLAILLRGFQLLAPGGRLVYSTCSMNPIENEAVIAAALDRWNKEAESEGKRTRRPRQQIELRSFDECAGELYRNAEADSPRLKVTPGLQDWPVYDSVMDCDYKNPDEVPVKRRHVIRPTLFPPSGASEDVSALKASLSKCMRVLPHQNDTGGFFIAVLQKAALAEDTVVTPPSQQTSPAATPTSGVEESPPRGDDTSTTAPSDNNSNNKRSSPTDDTVTTKKRRKVLDAGRHEHYFEAAGEAEIKAVSAFYGIRLLGDDISGAGVSNACPLELPVDQCDLRLLSAKEGNRVLLTRSLRIWAQEPIDSQNPREGREEVSAPEETKVDLTGLGAKNPSIALEPLESEEARLECRLYLGSGGMQPLPFDGRRRLIRGQHTQKRLFVLSDGLSRIFHDHGGRNRRWVTLGIRAFELFDEKSRQRCSCPWRLTQEGLRTLLPYITRRIIFISIALARRLIVDQRQLTALEVTHAEARGELLNLSSCASPEAEVEEEARQKRRVLQGGAVAVVIVPPQLIPPGGHFPCASTGTEGTEDGTSETSKDGEETAPLTRYFSPQEEEAAKATSRLQGLRDAVAVACLLTNKGGLIPYIGKAEAIDLITTLYMTHQ